MPWKVNTVAELPHWMPIAHAVSAKFKAFSFPVIQFFRYSVIPYSAFYSVPLHSRCSLQLGSGRHSVESDEVVMHPPSESC